MESIKIRKGMKKIVLILLVLLLQFTNGESNVNVEFAKDLKQLTTIEKYYDNIRRHSLTLAHIAVESNNNPLAYNVSEGAAGVLQIRPIMVREVNRLVGYKKYSYKDRWSREKSIAMFIDYQNAVNPTWDAKTAARKWNGGYYGDRKTSTLGYWCLVKSHFKGNNNQFKFKKS